MAETTSTTPEDVEVRRMDQDMINDFGRLNNRLLEVRAELEQAKKDHEKIDDASTEMMMASSEGSTKIMLLVGESFIEASEEEVTEYCEKKQEEISSMISKLTKEEAEIVTKQADLKKVLYGRFGDSINLEN
jgi:prefoldin subunit 4